jgi:mono/diheme cytochrome c family protein
MSHITIDAARWTTVLAFAIACTTEARPVTVERTAVALGRTGAPPALYFTVRDAGARGDSVTRIVVDAAQAVAMQSPRPHRVPTSGTSSAAMMMIVSSAPIGAGGTLRFAPGGYEGALWGLRRALAPGDSVRVTVMLASGRAATAVAPVVAYADLEATLDPSSSAGPATEPTVAEGLKLYRSNGCIGCHGPDGHGDGPVARDLLPPPRDFRVAAAFTGGTDVESIALTLAVGVPSGGSMPYYAHLSNAERRAIARYVISLRTTTISKDD